MLDVKVLRDDPERVKKGIAAKNADPKLVDTFLKLDEDWRKTTSSLEALRSEQKRLSAERKIEEAKKNKEGIKALEQKVGEIEKERESVWATIPNIPSEDTPIGKDDTANKVIRKWGEPRKFSAEGGSASGGDFTPLDHVALGEKLKIIDTERASKVSGSRFGYLMGGAARLELALVSFAMDVLGDEKILKKIASKIEKGYSSKPFIPVIPPVMIRPEVFEKMARLEPKEERYYIPSDDVYLVGSAEHTLGPLHMNETIKEDDLPIRYVGFSPAFRRESGSYGKDVRGILRVHQFEKVEMETFTAPENSIKEQNFIVAIQEYLMQQLKLPYQVVAISSGDMGGPDTRQIDIETWLPGQGRYRETHTSDLMTDYQARRLGTRIKRKDGATVYAHMNDATAFAGRTLIAILENYQTKDGKVEVPKVLQKYVGLKKIA